MSGIEIKFIKALSMPPVPVPDSLYFIDEGTYYELFVTDSNGIAHPMAVIWDNLPGRPNVSAAQIEQAVALMHSHLNKTQLDKISEDVSGFMTYDGTPVTGIIPLADDAARLAIGSPLQDKIYFVKSTTALWFWNGSVWDHAGQIEATQDVNMHDLLVTGDLTVQGDVFLQGSVVQVDSQIETADAVIDMNWGEAGPGVTLGYSGLHIDRGTSNNYWLGFDEIRDAFTVGQIAALSPAEIATTQVVATREDSPLNNGYAKWNAAAARFDAVSAASVLADTGAALDVDVVHKAGLETITGVKVFEGTPQIRSTSPVFTMRDTDGDDTTSVINVRFEESNANRIGYVGFNSGTNSNFDISNNTASGILRLMTNGAPIVTVQNDGLYITQISENLSEATGLFIEASGRIVYRELGSAAFESSSSFATAAQGSNADTAFGWGDFRDYGLGTLPGLENTLANWDTLPAEAKFLRSNSTVANPFGTSGTGIILPYAFDSRSSQLFFRQGSNDMVFRTSSADGVWSPIKRVWTNSDFTSTQISNWDDAYTYSQVGHLPFISSSFSGSTFNSGYAGDWNDLQSGVGYGNTASLNKPTSESAVFLTIRPSISLTNLALQLSGRNDEFQIRSNDAGTWNAWRALWTDKHFSSTQIANWDEAFGWGNWSVGVNKTFIDALNVDADTLDGIDSTGFSLVSHNHAFADLSDTDIASPASGHVIFHNGTDWRNGTLSQGGIEPAFSKNSAFNKNFGTTAGTIAEGNHTHGQYLEASDLTDGFDQIEESVLGVLADTTSSGANPNDFDPVTSMVSPVLAVARKQGTYYAIITVTLSSGANTPNAQLRFRVEDFANLGFNLTNFEAYVSHGGDWSRTKTHSFHTPLMALEENQEVCLTYNVNQPHYELDQYVLSIVQINP